MNRRIAVVVSALLLSVGAFSSAASADTTLERPGQPAVMNTKQEREEGKARTETQSLGAFREQYKAAGRPRMLVLWHRDLTDDISSRTAATTSTVTSTGGQVTVVSGSGVQSVNIPPSQQTVSVERDKGSSGKLVSLVPAARDAEFRSGFEAYLRDADVRLVDRDTVIRLTAHKDAKEGQRPHELDLQSVEMSALLDYSDYFLEISFTRDSAATGGLVPRISVIRTKTGEIVANVVPTELYKPDEDQYTWSATASGFRRGTDDAEYKVRASERGLTLEPKPKTAIDEGRDAGKALIQTLVGRLSP